ncbi:hypothetical protein [Lacticaseibacillus pantheris]|nr:hypothetical protein [Lacticaseibacillus pantheris]
MSKFEASYTGAKDAKDTAYNTTKATSALPKTASSGRTPTL